jgi:hypothetical protein
MDKNVHGHFWDKKMSVTVFGDLSNENVSIMLSVRFFERFFRTKVAKSDFGHF